MTSAVPAQNGTSLEHKLNGAPNSAGQQADGVASVPAHGIDPILEGKERAKAVMAASGINLPASAERNSKSSEESSTMEDGAAVNGASSSRKRSRSGSRKPPHTPNATKSQRPVDNDLDRYLLAEYRERDQIHAAHLNDQADRQRELFTEKNAELKDFEQLIHTRRMNPAAVFGYGYAGFGNGTTNEKEPRLVYPIQRRRPGHRRARRIYVNRTEMGHQADQLEELVPIRLDIEHDKIKLRDTFTYNLHERVTPSEIFAETLVEDFQIPPEYTGLMIQQINQKLNEQLQDHYPHVFIEEEPLDPHLPYYAYKNDEMRILIKLNITIGPHTLVDQFEWEINNPQNSPEEFAKQMTKDLSLSGEFTTAIAHQIREQSQMFTKSLYITGHPWDGRPIQDSDLLDSFLPSPIFSVFRPAQSAKDYTPYLYELSEADLQREELSILREQRRQKRSVTRRGGPALPDLKDRERTVRTLLISSVLPGAADSLDNARLFKLSRTSGRGRRPGAGRTDDLDSDESETEESEIEETIQITSGTARTRNIRNAATAAQAAMRANLGRSATPEVATLHHHETRTSARRLGFEVREREESTAEPQTLIVRLKISPQKFREWMKGRAKASAAQSRSGESTQLPTQTAAPLTIKSQTSTPQPHSSSMPHPTSGSTPNAEQNGQQTEWKYYPDGHVDAPVPLPQNQKSVSLDPFDKVLRTCAITN